MTFANISPQRVNLCWHLRERRSINRVADFLREFHVPPICSSAKRWVFCFPPTLQVPPLSIRGSCASHFHRQKDACFPPTLHVSPLSNHRSCASHFHRQKEGVFPPTLSSASVFRTHGHSR